MLSVLSKFFNLVEVWGLRPDGSNPCRHVHKYAEKRRERFLSREELSRLGEVLERLEADGSESIYVIAAFKLLVFTGCRLGEIQFLKWDYVTPNYLALPDSKTGARKVPLPPAARDILSRLPRMLGNPYVICGEIPGKAVHNIEKPWRRIRGLAGLEDVRIHDLRHTYASNAVMAGLSIPVLGKILGHTQIQTTMRYAHFADEPVRAAALAVSSQLEVMMAERHPPSIDVTRANRHG